MKVLKIKTLCLVLALIFGGSEAVSAIPPSGGLTLNYLTDNTDFFGKPKKKKKKKKKKDEEADAEKVPFKQKLWYGGGVNLGFNSFNGVSVFSIGVSPMVGYKFWGPLSVGPRLGVNYTSYKETGFKALGLVDWEAGLFLRSKIWGPIFAHAEISNEWIQRPVDYDYPNRKILKETYTRANQYVGLGYNNGDGGGGYELLVLYNFAVAGDASSDENPLGLRIGFTWKF